MSRFGKDLSKLMRKEHGEYCETIMKTKSKIPKEFLMGWDISDLSPNLKQSLRANMDSSIGASANEELLRKLHKDGRVFRKESS